MLQSTALSPRTTVWRHPWLDVGRLSPAVRATGGSLLRGALVLGCVMFIGVAAWVGDPAHYQHADPALARLLRAMALIKGMIAIAAAGAVFWRLGRPLSTPVAACYLLGVWVISGSSMLIWQLSYIVAAAVLFHVAALTLLVVSWREG